MFLVFCSLPSNQCQSSARNCVGFTMNLQFCKVQKKFNQTKTCRDSTTMINGRRQSLMIIYPFIVIYLLYAFVTIPESLYKRSGAVTNQWFVDAALVPLPSCYNATSDTISDDCEYYDPNEPHVPCSELYVPTKKPYTPTHIANHTHCCRPSDFRGCYFVEGSCQKMGASAYQKALHTGVLNCTALPGIECVGNRTYLIGDIPCRL